MSISKCDASQLYGSTVTAGAVHVKGSWVQLSASTPHAAKAIVVVIGNGSINVRVLVDIGVGAAGAEVVVVADICHGITNQAQHDQTAIYIPIGVAAGVRLSMRLQASTGSATRTCAVYLIEGDSDAAVVTLGAVTSTSNGTALDCGGTADTKTAWVQVSASLASDTEYLVLVVSGRGAGPSSTGITADYAIDVGVGAAGAEAVVWADVPVSVANSGLGTDTVFSPLSFGVALVIAAGSRVAVRAASTTTNTTLRIIDVVLLSVTDLPAGGPAARASFG